MRSYEELITLDTYAERLDYLTLGDNNYDSPRNESQRFFKSHAWLVVRNEIIMRDLGFDLGVFGLYIYDRVIVHHINPITMTDIVYGSSKLLDPNNLITNSLETHNKIHYVSRNEEYVEREPGDTILW